MVQLAAVIACGDVPDVQDVVSPAAFGVALGALEVAQPLKYPLDGGRIVAQEIGSLGYVIAIPTSTLMLSVGRFRRFWHTWYPRDSSTRFNRDKPNPCFIAGIVVTAIPSTSALLQIPSGSGKAFPVSVPAPSPAPLVMGCNPSYIKKPTKTQ